MHRTLLIALTFSLVSGTYPITPLPLSPQKAMANEEKTIFQAAKDGDLQRVKTLVRQGVSLTALDPEEGMAPIHWAANADQLEVVKYLLAQGVDVNLKDKTGSTALMPAVYNAFLFPNGFAMMTLLLENGADINIQDQSGMFPLWVAVNKEVTRGNLTEYDVVGFLLENGADPRLKLENKTVIDMAIDWSHKDMVYRLVKNGAPLDAAVIEFLNWDETKVAIAQRDKAKLKALQNTPKGAKTLTFYDSYGYISFAADWGYFDLIPLLLPEGKDLEMRDSENNTLLMVASRSSENTDLVKWLIRQGVNLNQSNKGGENALNKAIQGRAFDNAYLLLNSGIDIEKNSEKLFEDFHYLDTSPFVLTLIDALEKESLQKMELNTLDWVNQDNIERVFKQLEAKSYPWSKAELTGLFKLALQEKNLRLTLSILDRMNPDPEQLETLVFELYQPNEFKKNRTHHPFLAQLEKKLSQWSWSPSMKLLKSLVYGNEKQIKTLFQQYPVLKQEPSLNYSPVKLALIYHPDSSLYQTLLNEGAAFDDIAISDLLDLEGEVTAQTLKKLDTFSRSGLELTKLTLTEEILETNHEKLVQKLIDSLGWNPLPALKSYAAIEKEPYNSVAQIIAWTRKNQRSDLLRQVLSKPIIRNHKGIFLPSAIRQLDAELIPLLSPSPADLSRAEQEIQGLLNMLLKGEEYQKFQMMYSQLPPEQQGSKYDLVKALLKAGADINWQDNEGKTALMHAIENDHSI